MSRAAGGEAADAIRRLPVWVQVLVGVVSTLAVVQTNLSNQQRELDRLNTRVTGVEASAAAVSGKIEGLTAMVSTMSRQLERIEQRLDRGDK